jgi:phosphohistidine phosphatase SixA
MVRNFSFILILTLLGACSSDSGNKDSIKNQSNQSATQEQSVASSGGVEAYEINGTTMSGEEQNANFINRVGGQQLANNLRDGGYVIYIRHTKTDKDWGDQVSPELDFADCNTQRRLSPDGKAEAEQIGKGVKAANVPIGNVVSSEYCRAYNTADLAFGKYTKDSKLNFLPCVECTPEDYKEYAGRMSALLSAKPESGVNTFLVGHDDPFQGATMFVEPPNGIYPAPMGVSYVIKPMGAGKFTLVAKLLPSQWHSLAQF